MRRIPEVSLPFPALLALGLACLGPARAQAPSLAEQRTETLNGKRYLLTSHLSRQCKSVPANARGVLLGIFTYQFDHVQAKGILDSTLSRIGRAEGWTVDRVTNGAQVTADKLASYQVFFGDYISNWTSPGFPEAGRAALQDFVENKGKGLFVQHSSGDGTSTAWTWFRTYVHPCHYNGEAGRNAASTGKVGVFKGYRNAKSGEGHPILEGIAWNGKDSTTWQENELHTFDKSILDPAIMPEGFRALLSLNAATCGTPNTCGNGGYDYANAAGGNWPVSWTFPLKKGNIGYFMEGHDLKTMNSMTQPVWDRYFKQFMYFLAGYDTAEVIPDNLVPSQGGAYRAYAVDPSGITFHPGSKAGVLITQAGNHIVTLYDIRGRIVRQERGSASPIEYDFSPDLAGRRGVYVLRATVAGVERSRRFAF